MTGVQLARMGLIFAISAAWFCVPEARAANLGDNIRTASNPGPFLNQIQGYVRERMGKLSGSDPLEQSKAREDLVSEVVPPGAPSTLSPAFLATYAGVINDELMKVAQHQDIRVRLNAAIVAAKVADGAGNARLQPVVLALLEDPSDAVVWWALRAARGLLPQTLASPSGAGAADPLLVAVIQLGETRPAVIQAVYEALAIDQSKIPQGGQSRVLSAAIPAMHRVMKSRVSQYNKGVPVDPPAERMASGYLTAMEGYRSQTDEQKATTVQLISDLLGVAAERARDVGPDVRRDLVVMMRGVGATLFVVGQWESSAAIQAVARPISQLPVQSSPEQIRGVVQPVHPAITGVRKFARITPPPKISEMARDGGSTTGSADSANGP